MKKTPSKSKDKTVNTQEEQPDQFLILGHLIKYNLYLLSKAVVFSSVVSKCPDLNSAVNETHDIMQKLDLDFRKTS